MTPMSPDLKSAFAYMKPLCDAVMICPSPQIVKTLSQRVLDLKPAVLQEMQLYILFPIAIHLKSKDMSDKFDIKRNLVQMMKTVLERVQIDSPDVFIKYHTCLLNLIFDKDQPGMVAPVSEELKLEVIESLATIMLKTDLPTRIKLFKSNIPLLAQTIFIAVHIAKLEKLRSLRLASISCLTAYTATHKALAEPPGRAANRSLECLASDMAATILPGVLAALQDVAMSDNPGHSVVVAALNAIHKIVCLVMNDRHLGKQDCITVENFSRMLQVKMKYNSKREVAKNPKELSKKTPEWYSMAGEKLKLVTDSISSLQAHEHVKVRLELAVYCSRLLYECHRTMRPSIPTVVDVLIALSKDEYPAVAKYSSDRLIGYFQTGEDCKSRTLDFIADNFVSTLQELPRTLNNIDTSRKLSIVNLLHGYIRLLGDGSRPQRLTSTLTLPRSLYRACHSLMEAVRLTSHVTVMGQLAVRDVSSPIPQTTPWCKLKHIDDKTTETRLQEICRLLGEVECADLIVDQLLECFLDKGDRKEAVYLMNWMGTAPNTDPNITMRILEKYIEDEVWYLPLDVATADSEMISSGDTLDVSVYNPRAWQKDCVPDLFEGATEIRYTDISYAKPRTERPIDPNSCRSLAEAQNNMVLSCLLTDGVGMLALRLKEEFQPYLLKTLCMVLERVGSQYEMLHLSGLKAINDIAAACGHQNVNELIQHNADYFTFEVTTRLKKAWNSQSALRILTVVMEYSDSSIMTCLYGIVTDVLVQSCDKYHGSDLTAYLQVFLTFVTCIQKWFPHSTNQINKEDTNHISLDPLQDTIDYVSNLEKSEKLVSDEEFEKELGKSGEEMYKEDTNEEDDLHYNDAVSDEKSPPPQYVTLTVTILKRCINFIPSKRREEKLLALEVIDQGLRILEMYEDELLPLVHLIWAPLVVRFEEIDQPVVLRRAFQVLVTMADLSKDFIRNRCVKEVLPSLYKFLHKSSHDSYLKDVGSAYRQSQAFKLQTAILQSLPHLIVDLSLHDEQLEKAMDCVDHYLSNRQPKPLQAFAVSFFKTMLRHDHGATWHHLRKLCDNDCKLEPPTTITTFNLRSVIGTPYQAQNQCLKDNVKSIFDVI